MKRIFTLLLTTFLIASLFCSCANDTDSKQISVKNTTSDSSTASKTVDESYTFTDDLNREITVQSCTHTAALLGSYADIWMLSGGTVCATVDDAWDDFHLSLSEDIVNLGGTKNLSLEAIFSSEPDFILASTNTPQHLEWQTAFESAGITVAYFDVSTFDDYLRMLKICTDLNDTPELYTEYGTALQSQIEQIIDKSTTNMEKNGAQTVLVLRASAASIRAKNSHDNVLGEALKSMGCLNIADNDETLLENLSLESILITNPDKIFIVQLGDDEEGMKRNIETSFSENPLWQKLDAVKNNEVYYMDKHLFNLKPNARWGETYEQLEEILFHE